MSEKSTQHKHNQAMQPPNHTVDGRSFTPQFEQAKDKAGGRPLPVPIRRKMERSFGVDFANVRIHENNRARRYAADAITEGSAIHFAPGAYQPHTADGQELLGHELAHVVQQRRGQVPRHENPHQPNARLEAEAETAGLQVAKNLPTAVSFRQTGSIPNGGAPAIQPGKTKKDKQEEEKKEGAKSPTPYSQDDDGGASAHGLIGFDEAASTAASSSAVQAQLQANIAREQDPMTAVARQQATAGPVKQAIMRGTRALFRQGNPSKEQIAREKRLAESREAHKEQLDQTAAQSSLPGPVLTAARKFNELAGRDNPPLADVRSAKGAKTELRQNVPGLQSRQMADTAVRVAQTVGAKAPVVGGAIDAAGSAVRGKLAESAAQKMEEAAGQTHNPLTKMLIEANASTSKSEARDRYIDSGASASKALLDLAPVPGLSSAAGPVISKVGGTLKGEATAEKRRDATITASRAVSRTTTKPAARLPQALEREIKKAAKERKKKGS